MLSERRRISPLMRKRDSTLSTPPMRFCGSLSEVVSCPTLDSSLATSVLRATTAVSVCSFLNLPAHARVQARRAREVLQVFSYRLLETGSFSTDFSCCKKEQTYKPTDEYC